MTSTAAAPTGGYEELAPFYDAFTSGSDYENWTARILALLASYGWNGSSVLDVACGTGNSFLPLRRHGFAVTGCDRSPAMLAEAARKAPDVPLIEADMRDLPRGRSRMSASISGTSGALRAASASIAGERSQPVTANPWRRSGRKLLPVPHATSSTLLPFHPYDAKSAKIRAVQFS